MATGGAGGIGGNGGNSGDGGDGGDGGGGLRADFEISRGMEVSGKNQDLHFITLCIGLTIGAQVMAVAEEREVLEMEASEVKAWATSQRNGRL